MQKFKNQIQSLFEKLELKQDRLLQNDNIRIELKNWKYTKIYYNIFIQVDNSINKTNLFRGGNHSSVVFAGSRER